MNSQTECEQYIKQEEDPLSVIEIKTEPLVEQTQETLDKILQNYVKKSQDEKKIGKEGESIVISAVYSLCETYGTDFQEQKFDNYLQEKVEGTQESLGKLFEDLEDEQESAGEDGTNEVHSSYQTYGTDFEEQKCDDYLQEKANICTNNGDDTKYNFMYSKPSINTQAGDRFFKCNICNKLFTYKLFSYALCDTIEKPLNCNFCNKSSVQKSNPSAHRRSHTNEKPFNCEICNKSFSYKSNLSNHKRIHTNTKLLICITCSKSFSKKSHLSDHIRTHTNEKPFKCKICNKSFSQTAHLRGHIRTHTNVNPFKCKICSKSFSQMSYLTKHSCRHTNEKPFKCNICNNLFYTKSSIATHIRRTHTSEKPFKCNLCSKSFSQKSHIKDHIRTHTKEKPFNCNICNKSFNQKSNLIKHLRCHTNVILQ